MLLSRRINLAYIFPMLYSLIMVINDVRTFHIRLGNIDRYLLYKIITIFILILVTKLIIYLYREIKQNNQNIKDYVKYTSFYLIFLGILLFIFWPGYWVWDEWFVYNNATQFIIGSWQHILTSYYFIIAMIIFPGGMGAILLLHLVLVSCLVGYTVCVSKRMFVGSYYLLMYIPFLLPQFLSFIFYPLRFVPLSLSLLTLFFILIDYKYLKKEIPIKNVIAFSFILVFISLIKSETIIILFFIGFMVYFSVGKYITKKQVFIGSLVFLIFFGVIYNKQSHKEGERGWEYILLATLNPLSMLLQPAEHSLISLKDMERLNKVINTDFLKKYPQVEETPAYWKASDNGDISRSRLIRKNTTMSTKLIYFKTYFKIVMYNFPKFIKFRYLTYKYSIIRHIKVYDWKDVLGKGVTFSPVSKNIQGWISRNIYGIDAPPSSFHYILDQIYVYLWNILSLILLVVAFIKKDIFEGTCFAFFISLGLILFITSPASYYMYYFPIYLGLSVFSIWYILKLFVMKKELKGNING